MYRYYNNQSRGTHHTCDTCAYLLKYTFIEISPNKSKFSQFALIVDFHVIKNTTKKNNHITYVESELNLLFFDNIPNNNRSVIIKNTRGYEIRLKRYAKINHCSCRYMIVMK